MVDVDKLRGRMSEKRITYKAMAQSLNMSPRVFGERMKRGVFGTDHVEVFIDVLDITNPADYFCVKKVT